MRAVGLGRCELYPVDDSHRKRDHDSRKSNIGGDAEEFLHFDRTFDVMSPRHCDENELNLNGLWAVDIHDLLN